MNTARGFSRVKSNAFLYVLRDDELLWRPFRDDNPYTKLLPHLSRKCFMSLVAVLQV